MRYFAWYDKQGKMHGWKLLTGEQITTLTNTLMHTPKQYEIFASIQRYEDDKIWCPMYMDLDNKDIHQAYADLISICNETEDMFDMIPDVYFSGGKGFHVIYPIIINHPQCHRIVQYIVSHLFSSLQSVDHSVYSERRLFREPNTYNLAGKKWKVKFDPYGPTLHEVLKLAENCGDKMKHIHYHVHSKFDKLVNEAVENINNTPHIQIVKSECFDTILPCIDYIINNKIENGHRNQALYICARYFRQNGLSEEEAYTYLKDHPTFGDKYIQSVLKSTYKNSPKSVGCKYGNDAQFLRTYCDKLCPIREDVKLF